MKHLLAAVMSLVLCVPVAAAQSPDEPYFEDPDCYPAPTRVVDIDDPDTRSSAGRIQLRKAARRSSGFQVALDATAGYSWYQLNFLSEEEFTGFVYGASLSLSWDTKPSRVGLILRGFYAPSLEGTVRPFMGSESDATADMWGLYLGFFAKYMGFYGTASLGVFHVGDIYRANHTSSVYAEDNEVDSTTIPELNVGLGYDIQIGRHLALRLGGEVGTCFFLTWRAAATGGLVVSF